MKEWLLDFLINRPKAVGLTRCSAALLSRKFSDDTAIVGLINNRDESEYREPNHNFVDWCPQNFLHINAEKTKELVVDYQEPRLDQQHSGETPPAMQAEVLRNEWKTPEDL